MADNNDISMNSFGIMDTMEMGMGNQELLNDLFSPETSTSNPEDIKPIINEVEDPAPKAAPAVPKGKEITPKVDGEENKQSSIADFLGNNSDDDDEDEDENLDSVLKPAKSADSNNEEDTNETESTQFSALANDLYKLGVFNKDDEDDDDTPINTPEEFLEKFNSEKKKGAIEVVDNFLGQFGEDYRNAFEAIFVKGVDPKDYFTTYNNVVGFAEMDLSDENNQIKIMKQALTDQGFEPEDLSTEIERLQNYGDLESVATKHHKILVKKEAAKLSQMEQESEKVLQQKSAVRNQYITNVRSILEDRVKAKEFDGIPINPKLAGELQDFLLVDKWKTASGENLTDFDRTILDLKRPENHAMKVKLGLILKILEKDPTLSTIQNKGVTKKSNELFGEVARQVTKAKSNVSGGSQAKTNSWFQ